MESQCELVEQLKLLIKRPINFYLGHGNLDLVYSIILLIHQIIGLIIFDSFLLNLFWNNLLTIISFQFHLINNRTPL